MAECAALLRSTFFQHILLTEEVELRQPLQSACVRRIDQARRQFGKKGPDLLEPSPACPLRSSAGAADPIPFSAITQLVERRNQRASKAPYELFVTGLTRR